MSTIWYGYGSPTTPLTGALKSFDGSSYVTEQLPLYSGSDEGQIISIYYGSAQNIWCCDTAEGRVWKNNGSSWESVNHGFSGSSQYEFNQIDGLSNGKIFISARYQDGSDDSRIYYYDASGSYNDPSNWHEATRSGGTGLSGLAAMNDSCILAGEQNIGTLWCYNPNTNTWTSIWDKNNGQGPKYIYKLDSENAWFAAGDYMGHFTTSVSSPPGGVVAEYYCLDWYYTPPNPDYGTNAVSFYAYGIWANSNEDVWAVGYDSYAPPSGGADQKANIYHFDGTYWESGSFKDSTKIAGTNTGDFVRHVWGYNNGGTINVFAGGGNAAPCPPMYYYNGTTWDHLSPAPSEGSGTLGNYYAGGVPLSLIGEPLPISKCVVIGPDYTLNYYGCSITQHSNQSQASVVVSPFVFAHKGMNIRFSSGQQTGSFA